MPAYKLSNITIKEGISRLAAVKWIKQNGYGSNTPDAVSALRDFEKAGHVCGSASSHYLKLFGEVFDFSHETIESMDEKIERLRREEKDKKYKAAKEWYDTLSVENKAHVDFLSVNRYSPAIG